MVVMSSERLAKLISAVASPVVIAPVAWAIVIGVYSVSMGLFLQWFGLYILAAIVPPVLYVVYGVRSGSITDVHIKVRTQRFVPFVLATVSSALLALLYVWFDAPRELVIMALIMSVAALFFTVITLFWKISLHAGVFAAGAVIMGGLLGWGWLWSLALLPAVIWARVKRRRHTLGQALAGVGLAAAVVLVMLWLLV